MTRLNELKQQLVLDSENWEIPFMEFVDDLRRTKDKSLIIEPFEKSNDKFDALIASTIEYLCNELKLETPEWILDVPACKTPWFVSGIESIKAITLVESPLEFRARKIFVLQNFLERA